MGQPSSDVVKHKLTCILKLRGELKKVVGKGDSDTDMADWMSRAALEFIGEGGLGYSFNNIASPLSNEYARAVKQLL